VFAFRRRAASFPDNLMSNSNSEGPSGNDWEDRGEVAWNEFDWERYLRDQEAAIEGYQKLYDACPEVPSRIDAVAEQMGWSVDEWTEEGSVTSDDDDDADDDDDEIDFDEDGDVYTLHKNPIFIATKAISLGLRQKWLATATAPNHVTQPLALSVLSVLHRGEDDAVQAIHALDFGDYAMAISLFKRALGAINATLALLNEESPTSQPALAIFRLQALPRLFDLREIWLRVINECRDELDRPPEPEDQND